MSYTPINWQSGDTITAEKMNKMDNGWGFSYDSLFSETVTTAYDEEEELNSGFLVYHNSISANIIKVTFNGTEYTCEKIEQLTGVCAYGGIGATGPDFTEYPFALLSNASGMNIIYTETAGTYTISATANALQISDDFSTAVISVAPQLSLIFYVENNITTWQEVTDAISRGKVVVANGRGRSLLVSSTEITSHGDYTCYAVGADNSGVSTVTSSVVSADSVVNFGGQIK